MSYLLIATYFQMVTKPGMWQETSGLKLSIQINTSQSYK